MVNISVRPCRSGEEQYVAEAHRRVYASEYQRGPIFSGYAVQVVMDFAAKPKSPREEMWVAVCGEQPMGSVMLCETEQPSVGQLRLFLVEKDYRRCGVGAMLMDALLQKARAAGYEKLVLLTASPLEDAIHCYEKRGFRETGRTENTDWRTDGGTIYEIMMEKDLYN